MTQAIPIFMYHHVSPHPGLVTISPETFDAQMHYLSENGFHCTTPEAVANYIQTGKPLPQKSVLLTFDDGYLDNYAYAYPILKKYGLKATLFGITGWFHEGPIREIDEARATCPDHADCANAIREGKGDEVMLRWSEIEKMIAEDVFNLHSHTHTHTRFDKTNQPLVAKIAALDQDLALSKETLKKRLGIESAHLCWPQGYYDAEYIKAANAAGFTMLYTTEKRPVVFGCDTNTLGRVVIKDKAGSWFSSRLWIYSRPTISKIYTAIRGS